MNLIVWAGIIAIVVSVPVFAGRPPLPMGSSDHRRALRALRRLHLEHSHG